MKAADFLEMSGAQLQSRLSAGHGIDPGALDQSTYRGLSLGLPKAAVAMTWLTFRKVFHRDPESGALRGWNVRLEQRGLDAPSVPMRKGGAPFTFGHYLVRDPDPDASPIPLPPGALLLDYGRGGNPRLDATSKLRDPLVALLPGSVDLPLGWSYVELGKLRVRTPSFLVLEREGALDHALPPPRGG